MVLHTVNTNFTKLGIRFEQWTGTEASAIDCFKFPDNSVISRPGVPG